MLIKLRDNTGTRTSIEIEPDETIHRLKLKLASMFGIPVERLGLLCLGKPLISGTLIDYSISDGSEICLVRYLVGGACAANPSESAGVWFRDNERKSTPLPAISLSSTYFNRSTNITGYHDQSVDYEGRSRGSCYAHAACYAYLHTITRIYGARCPPSFAACFRVADYSRGKGGIVSKSLENLEKAFGFGVRWVVMPHQKAPETRDIMMQSVVVSFTTSNEGWRSIARGELLQLPPGRSTDEWHATLMEGCDVFHRWTVAKNTWGDRTATPRFALNLGALHDWYVTRVFFTLESIRGKTTKILPPPRMERFVARLNGQPVHCAWMDELTATYTSDYVCQPDSSRTGERGFIAFDVDEWITAMRH
jgi:hypothetical protein